jgi:DNA anti-recombination protein RmuC
MDTARISGQAIRAANASVTDSVQGLTLASQSQKKVRLCGLIRALKDIRSAPNSRLDKESENYAVARAQAQEILKAVKAQDSHATRRKTKLANSILEELERRSSDNTKRAVAFDLVGPLESEIEERQLRLVAKFRRYGGECRNVKPSSTPLSAADVQPIEVRRRLIAS